MTQALEREVSLMCNLSKGVEEKGIQKGFQMGMQQGLQQGVQQGIQQGFQQGIQQGIQQGVQQGMQQGVQQGMQQGSEKATISFIKSIMDTMNLSILQAMDALKIPEADRQKYIDELEQGMDA
jgi:flagellar biosynthesis/type III secretory pathway protein FliH